MARFKISALFFVFFALLAANTYVRFDIPSRPLHVLQGMVDTVITAWLGNTFAALILVAFAVGVPLLTMRKSYEGQADLVLKSTGSALKGEIYKPTQAEKTAANKPMFGNRN